MIWAGRPEAVWRQPMLSPLSVSPPVDVASISNPGRVHLPVHILVKQSAMKLGPDRLSK